MGADAAGEGAAAGIDVADPAGAGIAEAGAGAACAGAAGALDAVAGSVASARAEVTAGA
ncbi:MULTISPECIES: hypothetical protein [unclassified Microbacterium]|uniref:hypothetical protein n=1 Tax=unclassified Microbacterium TaxID=2609290 RepID=UPI00364609B0